MKRQFVTCLLVAALLLTFRPHASASMDGARLRALDIAVKMRNAGYTFTSGDSGLLAKGQVSGLIRTTLLQGNNYALVAGGCEDGYDVDIAVFDENGNVVAKDTDSQPVAVALVTPRWTGTFFIRVGMYDATRNGAHYVLLLGRK